MDNVLQVAERCTKHKNLRPCERCGDAPLAETFSGQQPAPVKRSETIQGRSETISRDTAMEDLGARITEASAAGVCAAEGCGVVLERKGKKPPTYCSAGCRLRAFRALKKRMAF